MSAMLPPPATSVRTRVLSNLKHIEPFKRGGTKNSHTPRQGKYVQPHDRVAYWNIVPGDEVRVRVGGKRVKNADGTLSRERIRYQGIVDTIDRERNLAWLRAPENGDESLIPRSKKHMIPQLMEPEKGVAGGITPNVMWKPKAVHYSNLQLRVPADLNLPTDIKLDLKKGVYAARIERSRGKVGWDSKNKGFMWKRYAVVKTPEGNLKIEVPFKEDEKREAPRKSYTAPASVVYSETWTPWSPDAPTWVLPRRPVASPHSVERTLVTLQARARAAQAKGADQFGKVSLGVAATSAAMRARQETLATQIEQNTGSGSSQSSAAAAAATSYLASSDNSDLQQFQSTMIPGRSKQSESLPVYDGFIRQLIGKIKRPLLPQPPSPSELLWMSRYSMRNWYARQTENSKAATAADAEADEASSQRPVFSALDYLDVAPIGGPESTRWHSVSSPASKNADRLLRDQSGRLLNADNVTQDDVKDWPIELLMKDDLMNENGKVHRTRRWEARRKAAKEARILLEREQKENLRALRNATL